VLQATRADAVGTFFVFLHLLKRQAKGSSIDGNNPAYIIVGDTINDLDATISGPQADLNLGIKTFVNGTEMRPVQINTSTAATDTIDYVVTNQTGLTAMPQGRLSHARLVQRNHLLGVISRSIPFPTPQQPTRHPQPRINFPTPIVLHVRHPMWPCTVKRRFVRGLPKNGDVPKSRFLP
jgi:hypothetical protein